MRDERIFSNVIGKQLEPDERRKVRGHTDKWYDKTDRRNNISVFAEQNLHIGKWSASVGALASHNKFTNGKLKFFPGIDLAFRPNDLLRIYASANTAMRLPTFTDLSYDTATHISNPYMEPEYSTEYEFGTRFTAARSFFNVTYFYRNIEKTIDWEVRNDMRQSINHDTNIFMHGISMGGVWNVGNNFPIQSVSVYYTYMTGNTSTDQYRSQYVMTYLRHKLNIGLTHRIFEKICAHWQVGWQDRNGGFMQYNIADNTETATSYASFWKTDLRIYRQTERINVFVEATNIGGKQYQDIGNVLLPGRWIRAGIALTISNF